MATRYSFDSTTPPQPTTEVEFSLQTRATLRRNNVRIIGQGETTLLFCNGLGCSQHIWQYLTPALATRYRLVLFDHVGSGESDMAAYAPARYATLDGYAQDTVDICRALNLRQAVVVGHSVGATIALLAAVQAPEHFAKAVLLACSPYYVNEPGYYGGFEREDLLQVMASMETDYMSWTTTFADFLLGPRSSNQFGAEFIDMLCHANPLATKQFARVAFLSDNRADVPRLRLPTLVVQCTDDAVAPAEVGDYLLACLPQAQLVTLRATGHLPHLSAPLETLAVVQSFLRS